MALTNQSSFPAKVIHHCQKQIIIMAIKIMGIRKQHNLITNVAFILISISILTSLIIFVSLIFPYTTKERNDFRPYIGY